MNKFIFARTWAQGKTFKELAAPNYQDFEIITTADALKGTYVEEYFLLGTSENIEKHLSNLGMTLEESLMKYNGYSKNKKAIVFSVTKKGEFDISVYNGEIERELTKATRTWQAEMKDPLVAKAYLITKEAFFSKYIQPVLDAEDEEE